MCLKHHQVLTNLHIISTYFYGLTLLFFYSLQVQSLKFRPQDSFYGWTPIITDHKRIFLAHHILNSTFLGYTDNLRVVQPPRLGFGEPRLQDLDYK